MIDQVEQLATDKSDAQNVLDQLPIRRQEECNFLFDSLAVKNEKTSGVERLGIWGAYAAAVAVAAGLAGLLIWMMGRR